ncbi:MAG: hypothetical protein ACRDZO_15670, partial [Egibacteraceae bacterium]
MVNTTKTARPFEVTADGRGMTGRAGLSLVAQLADRVGLTGHLRRTIGGCRSWRVHDPGKVVRDLALTLADGGDALRHMKVLDGQPECVRRHRVGGHCQPHDHRAGRPRAGGRGADRRAARRPRAGVG